MPWSCSCAPRVPEAGGAGSDLGSGMLIVQDFNLPRIRSVIERYVSHCQGADWPETAAQVSRVAIWEFEDDQEGAS
ncbi:Imm8 family immunity protein [Deinococcus sp.]|uniref:Imm8 family immunity protein n=1 Tax=Deinococcus sp. TaxID=47478 RepID=UPI0038D495A5